MLGITNPWTFLLGTVAIVLLPGPNTIFVLTVAGRFGVRAGYRAAAGVWLGDSVLMTLSAAGAASLLHAYPALFLVVKWAGAAYLGYVGVRLVITTWRRRAADAPPAPMTLSTVKSPPVMSSSRITSTAARPVWS